ncbi:hypothetical protein [Pectinatus cerevisiiphilus]|uniref:Uncharacterized protein n=1 Tax=Pectinatus cerevisiiphilus TaxID=86956 RepID=A0A4R3KE44_9FIRM|nr:hypothetical protein [Pectinatus cerevisiiphilus]TCS81365.1 hypothetical protein EDC37_10263 [Pectinatus cerevisiiphilus]
MANPSVLATGVMNDYNVSSNQNGAISQVDSTGAVHAGVVTEIDKDPFKTHDPRVLSFKQSSTNKALVADYDLSNSLTKYGVFDPTVAGTWTLDPNKYFSNDDTTSNNWQTSNPYSIVTNGNDMYIMGYDQNTIVKIDMTDYTYTSTFYTYTPLAGKKGHGVDMDKVTIDGTDYIAALFINDDGSYANYGDSQLVILDFSGKTINTYNLNTNANSLNIDAAGTHAYITSYGGPQNAGGNNGSPYTSELQIVDFGKNSVIQTIGPKEAPVKTGDYIDVALVGSDAYVLTANYNDDFSQYTYRLVKAPQSSLYTNGTFDGSSDYTATVESGATWLLAYDGAVLWFVAGKLVYTIDTAVDMSSTALTLRANANDHSSDSQGLGISTAYGQLNTASVVIPYSAAAGVSRSAVSGGHTKFAKIMLPREILKKFGKA